MKMSGDSNDAFKNKLTLTLTLKEIYFQGMHV